MGVSQDSSSLYTKSHCIGGSRDWLIKGKIISKKMVDWLTDWLTNWLRVTELLCAWVSEWSGVGWSGVSGWVSAGVSAWVTEWVGGVWWCYNYWFPIYYQLKKHPNLIYACFIQFWHVVLIRQPINLYPSIRKKKSSTSSIHAAW